MINTVILSISIHTESHFLTICKINEVRIGISLTFLERTVNSIVISIAIVPVIAFVSRFIVSVMMSSELTIFVRANEMDVVNDTLWNLNTVPCPPKLICQLDQGML